MKQSCPWVINVKLTQEMKPLVHWPSWWIGKEQLIFMEIMPQCYIPQVFCSSLSSSIRKISDILCYRKGCEIRWEVERRFLQTVEVIQCARLGEMLFPFLGVLQKQSNTAQRGGWKVPAACILNKVGSSSSRTVVSFHVCRKVICSYFSILMLYK